MFQAFCLEHCLFLFYTIHFISNPTYSLDVFRPAWVIFNFFPKTADMGSDIAVISKIFPIPDIIVNLFFRKRYALMECQHIQNTEFNIGQTYLMIFFQNFMLIWQDNQFAVFYLPLLSLYCFINANMRSIYNLYYFIISLNSLYQLLIFYKTITECQIYLKQNQQV